MRRFNSINRPEQQEQKVPDNGYSDSGMHILGRIIARHLLAKRMSQITPVQEVSNENLFGRKRHSSH
jgi:hypothetical protein